MPQSLSPVDAAWFRLDEAQNTADIVALITFKEELDVERLRRIVTHTFRRFPQFRQRVVTGPGGRLKWQDAPDFEISDHIQHTRLEKGSRDELQTFVSGILTRDLNRDAPLWQLHVVDNVEGGGAIVAKVHHCLGDGFALVGVLLSLSDEDPSDAFDDTHQSSKVGFRSKVWDAIADAAKHPEQILEATRQSGSVATALGELAMMPFDRDSSLRAELTGIRKAAWSHAIELDRFKRIARKTSGTVNDVLMATLAGALRNWMRDAGDDVDMAGIRAAIPVNLRPIEEMGKELGNQFGLVFLDLPVESTRRNARLEAVRQSMNVLKESPQAVVSFGILGALGLAPEVIEHLAGDLFTRKASLVVTNVPGPREPIHLAGKEVDHLMFWVPHPALLGLGVSLLSYAGEVRIGVRADTGVTTRPEGLVAAFEAELEAMETEFLEEEP